MAERAELYAHVPPTGRPITIEVAHFTVDDNILGEEEIAEAMLQLRLHQDGGLSGMRSGQLRRCLCVEKREEHSDPGNWDKVAAMIKVAFRGGELALPCVWQMVVMITKGGGNNFRGIELVEVPWKEISSIINHRILSSIQFHDALHGFSAGRGTWTATLEENMLQQLIAMREMALNYISLELRKAYGDLYRY